MNPLAINNEVSSIPYNAPDVASDLEMVLAKAFPVTMVVKHVTAGIEFAKAIKSKYKVQAMSFAGHSLGGSIAQNQAVYFADYEKEGVNLSVSKGFEPFGVKNEMDNLLSHKSDADRLYYLTLNPVKAMKSWVCRAGVDWDCDGWQTIPDKLVTNYASYSSNIRFVAFGRKGDVIANLAASIGRKLEIDSAGKDSDFLELHYMSNYRYHEYSADGSLIDSLINKINSNTLKSSDNTVQKTKYKLYFDTPTFTNYEEL